MSHAENVKDRTLNSRSLTTYDLGVSKDKRGKRGEVNETQIEI